MKHSNFIMGPNYSHINSQVKAVLFDLKSLEQTLILNGWNLISYLMSLGFLLHDIKGIHMMWYFSFLTFQTSVCIVFDMQLSQRHKNCNFFG